jgi:hypothetical protein
MGLVSDITELFTELIDDEMVIEDGATFKVPGTPTIDPDNGTRSVSTTDTAVDCTPVFDQMEDWMPGELVEKADGYIIVPAENLTFTPEQGVQVTIDSVLWTVVGVQPYGIGGTSAATAAWAVFLGK